MRGDEARLVLGFPPNYRPTPAQVKAAYKRKVWESHPDLFPSHQKPHAESNFKLISEAYTCLLSGGKGEDSASVKTGVPRTHGHGGKRNHPFIRLPFLFLIVGTVALGGLNATRAYRKQKGEYPSHNPFLP
ncbi:uncharacterized protein LOC107426202 isoform X2 [Ziziphus jujuba]|uniref:Uncharacterized protein LOC107426202 isoform X2 n=1 Tax=Ziziphus jujuba TaxID=326968 RepID=A0A6P4B0J7_ZIZJJ|nr:uncharacterized protein LOC107426202 isoform X2 [Ziziphus jujuba]